MLIKYRLTDKGLGIFADRVRELVDKGSVINFAFENAPNGTTAVFESKDKPFYRTLDDKCSCSIEEKFLDKTVSIAVFSPNHKNIWQCEKIYVTRKNDVVMVSAEDIDLADELRKLKLFCNELDSRCSDLQKYCEKLESKLTELLNGYDII